MTAIKLPYRSILTSAGILDKARSTAGVSINKSSYFKPENGFVVKQVKRDCSAGYYHILLNFLREIADKDVQQHWLLLERIVGRPFL